MINTDKALTFSLLSSFTIGLEPAIKLTKWYCLMSIFMYEYEYGHA